MNLVITGASTRQFDYLELFVESLREQGRFKGDIAVCDNLVGGDWDNPGTYADGGSFTRAQLDFLNSYGCKVYVYSDLLSANSIDRDEIEQIPSYTQRYPHKLVYSTLISKLYLRKARYICYFDSDTYFQKEIQPLFEKFGSKGLYVSPEMKKISGNPYLSKWIKSSNFGKSSDQGFFEKTMESSKNYCSGFLGGRAEDLHGFFLMCFLLSSNRFVDFYSDQPLLNIAKSYFRYDVSELSPEFVRHLGDLPKEELSIKDGKVLYRGKMSLAVHFNGDTKDVFDALRRTGKGSYQLGQLAKLTLKVRRLMTTVKSCIMRSAAFFQ